MKKLLALGLALVIAAGTAFAGGGQQASSSGGAAKADPAKTMAFLIRNQNEDFLRLCSDAVQKLSQEKGFKINVQDALGDPSTQTDQLTSLIQQGYRHFIIIPFVSELSETFNDMILQVGGSAAYYNIQPTTAALK
jgi:ABC-type sugar transport system substrate-binding protein